MWPCRRWPRQAPRARARGASWRRPHCGRPAQGRRNQNPVDFLSKLAWAHFWGARLKFRPAASAGARCLPVRASLANKRIALNWQKCHRSVPPSWGPSCGNRTGSLCGSRSGGGRGRGGHWRADLISSRCRPSRAPLCGVDSAVPMGSTVGWRFTEVFEGSKEPHHAGAPDARQRKDGGARACSARAHTAARGAGACVERDERTAGARHGRSRSPSAATRLLGSVARGARPRARWRPRAARGCAPRPRGARTALFNRVRSVRARPRASFGISTSFRHPPTRIPTARAHASMLRIPLPAPAPFPRAKHH